jgi:hypothetical protein
MVEDFIFDIQFKRNSLVSKWLQGPIHLWHGACISSEQPHERTQNRIPYAIGLRSVLCARRSSSLGRTVALGWPFDGRSELKAGDHEHCV